MTFEIWHCKLRHPNMKIVRQVLDDNNIVTTIPKSYMYLYFQMGKSHKLPFNDSKTVYHATLE